MENKILKIENKKDASFLRKRTIDFDFRKLSRREINELIAKMRKTMKQARGIGLAANQIGLDTRIFVAQIQKTDRRGNPRSLSASEQKFYAIFNPKIIKYSQQKTPLEEGCLSVPNVYGSVERPEKITLIGFDKNGRKIKIKAWGLLAKVFQHEVDHLNGKLFIDRTKELYEYPTTERLKEREEKMKS